MNRFATTTAVMLALALLLAPGASAGLTPTERQTVRILNGVRAQHGLGPLTVSRSLSRAADSHSRDMLRRDFLDHSSSNGMSFDRRIRRYYRAHKVGETLAALGRRRGGAGTVVQMWLNSPPHRAILLDGGFTTIGIARRWGTLGSSRMAVVTADFASRR